MREAAEKIGEALGESFDGDAYTLLMAFYKNTSFDIEIRIDAAKAAIPFEKTALAGDYRAHPIRREGR